MYITNLTEQTKKPAASVAAPKPASLKPPVSKSALARPSVASILKSCPAKTHQTSNSSFLKPTEKKPFSTIVHSVEEEDDDAPVLSLAQMIERKKAEKRKEQEMNKTGMPSPKKSKSPLVARHGDDLELLSDQIESGLSLAAAKASSKPQGSKPKTATKKTAAAAPKKKTIVIDSDEDEDSEPIVKPKATGSKKTNPSKKNDDSDASMDDLEKSDDDEDMIPRSQPTRGARGATKKIQYVDVDSDEELDDTLDLEEEEEEEDEEEESDDFEDDYASDDSA